MWCNNFYNAVAVECTLYLARPLIPIPILKFEKSQTFPICMEVGYLSFYLFFAGKITTLNQTLSIWLQAEFTGDIFLKTSACTD